MNNHVTLYNIAQAIQKAINEYKLIKHYKYDYIMTKNDFTQLVESKMSVKIESLNKTLYDDAVDMIDNAYVAKLI